MTKSSDPPPSDLSSSPISAKLSKSLDKASLTVPNGDIVAYPLDHTQISPVSNHNLPQIASPSDSYLYSRPENRSPRRYIAVDDYQSDDDDLYKIRPTGVGAGLYNSGNTCFIASVLQCLTHTVPLIESLGSIMHQGPCNGGNMRFCAMQALCSHIELSLRSSGECLRIDGFRDNLNYFSSDFMINHQEDAHEFLQSFLDKLERCCLDPCNQSGSTSSQDVNIVDNVFGGRLLSSLHCCNCNSISNTIEPSLGWSLEIEDVDDLGSALESFTRVEKLEDELMCDSCKMKVTKEKQLKLDKLPPVATFHLKRFKNDGVTMEKIFKHVKIPLELDLLPYMSTNQNLEVSTKYQLYAFVEHIGVRATFGHYSSYVRSAPQTWHNFDDSKVTRMSEDRVLSEDAYILFYAREGTPWFATTFDQLKQAFEVSPLDKQVFEAREASVSPTSVLDHTYESGHDSNKPCSDSERVSIADVNSDFHCNERQNEVFHSVECNSDSDDSGKNYAIDSPEDDKYEESSAETSHQKEPETSPADHRAYINDAYVPVSNVQNRETSPKRKAGEKARSLGAYEPKLKIQKPNSQPKRQGSFQIQREHLQAKKQEESSRTKLPVVRSKFGADKKEAYSYLNKMKTPRSRMLAKALGGSSI